MHELVRLFHTSGSHELWGWFKTSRQLTVPNESPVLFVGRRYVAIHQYSTRLSSDDLHADPSPLERHAARYARLEDRFC